MQQEGQFHKRMGYWSLTAASLGGVIGSGWLFGAMYAAQVAGPESIVSWIVGGVALILLAIVFVELAISRPESGGLVRWPRYTNGSLVASIIGWGIWLGYAANPPTEASGIVQYASKYVPGVYNGTQLTFFGILIAIILLILFVLINYFGVQIFARANLIVTILKFIVPGITLVALFVSGFHPANFTQYGGFAPYGWSPGLSAIATAGIIFAYTGFRAAIDLSGEAVNPARDIPRAVVTAIIVAILLYVGLELAFTGAVPSSLLARAGWHGVNYSSPFAQLALTLNLVWLTWLIYADAIISPAGSSFVYTASNSRVAYGLAKNGFFPQFLAKLHPRFGVPTRALILNFLVGLLFLIPLKSWHSIIGITGTLGIFTYAAGSVSVLVYRRLHMTDRQYHIGGMMWIAPIGFIVSSLIIYWAGWDKLNKTIPILILGLLLYVWAYFRNRETPREIWGGVWIIAYLVAIFIVSFVGSFNGLGVLPAPWDSVLVAAISLLIYYWAIASGVGYLKQQPAEPTEDVPVESKVS